MTRSRLAVASLSAAALGLAAVLVPTASIAEPVTETPAASAEVIWADSVDDFAEIPIFGPDEFALSNSWQWSSPAEPGTSLLSDYGTFDENGFTANGSSPVALLHGLPAPISGTDLPAFVAESSTNVGPEAFTGVFVADLAEEIPSAQIFTTVDGFHGEDTLWNAGEGDASTADLAALLTGEDLSVVGYIVVFPGTLPTASPLPEDETQPELLRQAPGIEGATTLDALFAQAGPAVALRAAEPAAAGIASFRVGDLTTYFTPQPTAALALSSASITVAQATTTGFTITGSGFAPGETVTTGIGTGQMGDSLPDTFVADADGNVSGTIVLPAGWAAAGDYFIVLVGESSGQVASSALAITGAAPVAVPVPGEATYTG